MKNIYRIVYTAGFICLSCLSACNNFEEINTNPDSITKASASMLCTNFVLSNVKFNGRDSHAY